MQVALLERTVQAEREEEGEEEGGHRVTPFQVRLAGVSHPPPAQAGGERTKKALAQMPVLHGICPRA